MKNRIGCWLVVLAVAVAGCQSAAGIDEPPKEAEKKSDKPAAPAATPSPAKKPTYKLEKEPFKIEVSLKGVFEAEEATELSLRPEAWTGFNVVKAVEHGTRVKSGDQLIWLDMEKIDQAIKDLETERALADLAFQLAERDLPHAEKSLPLDLAAAERGKTQADEDLKRFVEIDRPFSVQSAQFMVKSSANFLEYSKEELRQLEKMYKADDLTEETEEIIVKRQRDQVEMAQFRLDTAKNQLDQTLKIELPRREIAVKENAVRQTLNVEKAKTTLKLSLDQKRLALEKMKYDRQKSAERLADLKKDREMMIVRAPADGIAYYGKSTRGSWSSATVASRLQPGGNLTAEEVIITIVKPRPIVVRATVEEKELALVRAGSQGKAVATALPDTKLPAKVQSVAAVPLNPGSFEAKIVVETGSETDALMPGMACTVKITAYQKEQALTALSTAVFSEELDEDKQFVYVAKKDGEPEKRSVKVGKKSGTKTEILEGLREGEEILLEKPEKKS